MVGSGFGNFSELAAELSGDGDGSIEWEEEVQEEGVDLGQFSELMTDRGAALDTAARDRTSSIRLSAMTSLLTDTLTATVAEQEAMSWAIALTKGNKLPDHLSPDEVEVIEQLAMVMQARSRTTTVTVQSRRQPAISGLRSLPALRPVN